MDIVNGVIQILSWITTPSCSYLDRHKKFKRNVDDLKRRVRDLNSKKGDIQAQLLTLDLSVKQVRKQVEDWLDDVERINNAEMPRIEEKVKKVSYFCRGRIGGHVREMIVAVEAIYQQGNFPEGLTVDKPRPSTIGITFPVENLEGEVDAKEKIWGYLNNDEVGVVGLWGIGGVGKTTIIKHIHNELVNMEPRRFDVVIWVTVSHPLSIRRLQHGIACKMQKILPEDEEELMRAAKLMKIMQVVKFVLILDDVWDKLSLEEVGIPRPTRENGCKVVVTSRSANVCNFMGCRLVKVNPLSSQESLNLFLDRVGLGSGVLDDPEFGNILRLVVNECAGLPLAIVVIAGTMKGVLDIYEWRHALRELRKCVVGDMIGGQGDEIFNRLKFSYDRLPNSKIQSCFLWCSLYPEDCDIRRTTLIEHWIDDGLIEESRSRREMHDEGHFIINRLENNCLLEKCSDEWGVKMHDVVRDMALHIKSTQFMVQARMQLKKMPEEQKWTTDVEKVSLMDNDITDIPPHMSPKCPVLSTLLLQGNENLKEIPDCFFSNMPELKVLNLSWCTFFEVLPSSVSNLKNLTTLVVHSGQYLKRVPSLVELKSLKKLDLHWALVETLPEGVETLVNLQYLDLNCDHLVDLPVGMLCNLTRLQHLEAPPKVMIRGEEVASLCELEYLIGNLEVADFNNFVSKRLETYTHYDLVVGGQHGDEGPYYDSNTVTLEGCEVRGENRLVLPDNLHELVINRCNFLKSLGDEFLQNAPTKLKRCWICECEGVECVVDAGSLLSSFKLTNIEVLFLSFMPNIQVLVKLELDRPSPGASASRALKGLFSTPIFSNLTYLSIYDCPRMKRLIPFQLLQCLQNVKEIDLHGCLEIEEIIGWEEEELGNHTTTTLSPLIPKLECLRLSKLPELRRISPGREVVVFEFLKSISISDCPKLKRIPLYLVGNTQASPPPALEEIRVKPKEWWESLEWDDCNAKNVLQPFVKY